MISIIIADAFGSLVNADLLETAAQAVLDIEKVDPSNELSIAIDGDAEIQALNLQFLGIDAPTDVLSFPSDETNPETGAPYLGDIMISYPRAKQQAENAGETVEDELQLLVVHGMLHLLGYDHAEPDEKATMWAAQQKALKHLGCKITRLPE